MARFEVEPWGEHRADLRTAWNTLSLMQFAEQPSPEKMNALLSDLRFYLKSNQPAPVVETPEQARRRMS